MEGTGKRKWMILRQLVIIATTVMVIEGAFCSLSMDFYADSCPRAEAMIGNAVRSASFFNPSTPAKLLRLVFHDCLIEGCDGSVLVDGNKTEKSDPANHSLGGFNVIDTAKTLLEAVCPETVSCADILALAARDGVNLAGGPFVKILTGRRDGRVSLAANVRSNIPDTIFSLDQMINLFAAKGLTQDDLVTLSGAHTIGTAHCNAFSDRFAFNSDGTLKSVDPSLSPDYSKQLLMKCPVNPNSSTVINNDPETSSVFDNAYYQNLESGKGLMQSDSVLVTDQRTNPRVHQFANDEGSFFESWEQSFIKLTSIDVKTGTDGEVRRSCRAFN